MPASAFALLGVFTLLSIGVGIGATWLIGPRTRAANILPVLAAFGGLYVVGHRTGLELGPTIVLFGYQVAIVQDVVVAVAAAAAAALIQRADPRPARRPNGREPPGSLTMLAVRLHGARDLRASEEPDPVPHAGESLVRVDGMGICGSDLHWFVEGGIGPIRLDRPVVPGHEMGGTIAAGPRRGERVAIEPGLPCGRCRYCLAGWVNLCPTGRFSGQGDVDGSLRQLMAWPTHLLFPVPDMITDEQVPLLEPLLICLHAETLRPVLAGDRVAVVGCGPIGLLQIQVATLGDPSHILAVEPLAHRRDAAAVAGASEAVAAVSPGVDPDFDVVFEASGSPEAVETAVDLCRPGGTVVLLGIPDADSTTFRASTARRKGLTLMLVRRSVPAHERAIRLIEAGKIRLDGLVSHRFPLHRSTEAFELAVERQGLKVVIEPNIAGS